MHYTKIIMNLESIEALLNFLLYTFLKRVLAINFFWKRLIKKLFEQLEEKG